MDSTNKQQCINKLTGAGATVAVQRIKRRKDILERFKSLRVKVVDNFRKLNFDNNCNEALERLNLQILSSMDPRDMTDTQELANILDEMKKEMMHVQLEEHEKQDIEEIESFVNLLNKCEVCGCLISKNNICNSCVQTHLISNE